MRYGIFRGPVRPENQIHRQRTWARLASAQRYAEEHESDRLRCLGFYLETGREIPPHHREPITAAAMPQESAPC
jgi:hypothetical protein